MELNLVNAFGFFLLNCWSFFSSLENLNESSLCCTPVLNYLKLNAGIFSTIARDQSLRMSEENLLNKYRPFKKKKKIKMLGRGCAFFPWRSSSGEMASLLSIQCSIVHPSIFPIQFYFIWIFSIISLKQNKFYCVITSPSRQSVPLCTNLRRCSPWLCSPFLQPYWTYLINLSTSSLISTPSLSQVSAPQWTTLIVSAP